MAELSVQVGKNGGDIAEIDSLTRQLRQELLGLDVDGVTFARDQPAPPGAKGDPVTAGVLVVTFANSTVLVSVFQAIRAWLGRGKDRHIVIKDDKRSWDLSGMSDAQYQQILDVLLKDADVRRR